MYFFNTHFLSTRDVPRRTQEVNYIAQIINARGKATWEQRSWKMRSEVSEKRMTFPSVGKSNWKELYKSAWAAITKYYSLSDLNNKHFFSHFSRTVSQRGRHRPLQFLLKVPSWLMDGCQLVESSHGEEQEREWDLISLSLRALISSWAPKTT